MIDGLKDWTNLLSDHPCSNIFQSPQIFEVYQRTKNYEPVFITTVDKTNNLLGLLVAVVQKEHSGLFGMFSARSIIFGGPLIKDSNPEVLDILLRKYNKQIATKVVYSQFRNLWEWSENMQKVFVENGFHYESHLDIINDLKLGKENLWRKLKPQARQKIKKAINIPLIFREVDNPTDFEHCLSIIKNTYKQIKLPCADDSLFLEIEGKYRVSGEFKPFAAVYQDRVIACRFILCYRKTIYDWYAGADSEHLDKYPNDFLPWKIMEWGINNGYEVFDFGGAGKPNVPYGVREFKLKFGGELVNFGRFGKVHNKLLFFVGKMGLSLYKMINGCLK